MNDGAPQERADPGPATDGPRRRLDSDPKSQPHGIGHRSGHGYPSAARRTPDAQRHLHATHAMPEPPESNDPIARASPSLATNLIEASDAARRAMDASLPPGASVRSASERLGLGRDAAWRFLSFARATSPLEMAKARPGRRAWRAILEALERADCDAELVETLRDAVDRLADAAGRPFQGSSNLTEYLARQAPQSDADRSTRHRLIRRTHLATRATSVAVIRSKLMLYLVVPAARSPGRADTVVLQLLDGVQRLVPGDMLPLATVETSDERLRSNLPEGTDLSTVLGRQGPVPPLLEDVSSPGVVGDEVRPMRRGGLPTAGFTAQNPNRVGPLRLAFGEWVPDAGPTCRAADDPAGEVVFLTAVRGWSEFAIFEVLWHRDIPADGAFEASSHAANLHISAAEVKDEPRLDVISTFDRCDSPTLPSPLGSANPTYRALLRRGLDAVGCRYEDFEHWRYFVECPPMRSYLLIRRPLAPRSAT